MKTTNFNKMTLTEKAEWMAENFPLNNVCSYQFFNLTSEAFDTYFKLLTEGNTDEVVRLYIEEDDYYLD